MDTNIEITRLASVTDKILEDFNLLLAILSDDVSLLTSDDLQKIINCNDSTIFVAIENNKIVGILTLISYRIPTGLKAWIEDVVVDKNMQGKGVGRLLMERAINHIQKAGIRSVNLTSSPHRIAANILYQKMGFVKRETNTYKLDL